MPARKSKSQIRKYERKADPVAITMTEMGQWQSAFEYFNGSLFSGVLRNDPYFSYQRRAHSRGYFSPDRYASRTLGALGRDEIALNPDAFVDRTDEQIASTLVHEMTHCWQKHHGEKYSARGYHNKEWAAKMEALGLQPSSTGAVGGKRTGQQMTHYIIPDGPFTIAFAKLAATGWKLNLQSAHRAGGTKAPNSKVKFSCASCDQNAWGKPDLAITCTLCGIEMQAERANADGAVLLYEPQPAMPQHSARSGG